MKQKTIVLETAYLTDSFNALNSLAMQQQSRATAQMHAQRQAMQ
jgi:hypothetical protein